ncbi:MAG TPA: DUF2339 domain-containing protein [Thermoleophilaceae bacterium]
MLSEDRLELLEERTEALTERLKRLEGWVDSGYVVTRPSLRPTRVAREERIPVARRRAGEHAKGDGERQFELPPETVAPQPVPQRKVERPAPRREVAVEDLLGGRVLAWLGGIAVLVGIVFFFALAVSHGWIGPAARTLIAGAGALALLGGGIWLHDHKGRTDAALAAVATAVAGLFATVTVAAQVYELVPSSVGLLLAAIVGATATALAVRWEARGVAALGIGGALLAPVLVGAPHNHHSIVFLLVAGAAASGVLLWQRWDWLAFGAFAITTPQWIAWLLHDPSVGAALAVMTGFGALNVAAAVGFEMRAHSERLRTASTFMLALNALALTLVGWFWLSGQDHRTTAELWLVAIAILHLGVGFGERRLDRVSHELGLVSLALGVAVADMAYGLIASGPALAVGWAGGAVAFALIKKHSRHGSKDELLAQIGLGAHIGLALVRTLIVDAPPSAVTGGAHAGLLSASVALSALAAACFTSARIGEDGLPQLRVALDALGLAALAYLTAIALSGVALPLAWAAEAAALAQIGKRSKDRLASYGALAFITLAGLHAGLFEAPPRALVYGVHHLAGVAGVLVVIGITTLRMARLWTGDERQRLVLYASAAFSVLFAASIAIVTAFQPGTSGAELSIFDIGTRQQGQVWLSAMWAMVGVIALVVGLRKDVRGVRVGALALLLVAVGKVFLYDLATLTSVYRVVSFVGLGLLLLAGAFAWQRMRPRPLPDLREAPSAVR